MSTRFVLFGLCCIAAAGYVSSKGMENLSPSHFTLVKEVQKMKHKVRKLANKVVHLLESREDLALRMDKETKRRSDEKVCYTQLGCFEMGEPWNSKLRPVKAPETPEVIHTTIHFYNRQDSKKPIYIPLYPEIKMDNAKFDPEKKSVIIVHGFMSSGHFLWMSQLKDVYLKEVDANVMIVDWGGGAQKKLYFQVAGNTRVVGRELALFVQFLIKNHKAVPEKFHLIGHSLGAHICSYLAKEVPGIGRITALDPAQPGFEGFDKKVRLDKSDANFVDVIHTDATPFVPNFGFGMMAPHGHVDFYMNGGYNQPRCYEPTKRTSIFSALAKAAEYQMEHLSRFVSCSHGRAHMYLTEALNSTKSCIFWGHRAIMKNVFKPASKHPHYMLRKKVPATFSNCTTENCVALGFDTDKTSLRGSFVIRTSGKPPFCSS